MRTIKINPVVTAWKCCNCKVNETTANKWINPPACLLCTELMEYQGIVELQTELIEGIAGGNEYRNAKTA